MAKAKKKAKAKPKKKAKARPKKKTKKKAPTRTLELCLPNKVFDDLARTDEKEIRRILTKMLGGRKKYGINKVVLRRKTRRSTPGALEKFAKPCF